MNKNLIKDLQLQPNKTDPSLCFSIKDCKLVGIHGSYVDDLLRPDDEEFRQWCLLTYERFVTTGDEKIQTTFSGLHITIFNGRTSMDEQIYVKQLKELDSSSLFADFRCMRMKLA